MPILLPDCRKGEVTTVRGHVSSLTRIRRPSIMTCAYDSNLNESAFGTS